MRTLTGLDELKRAEGEVLGTSDWHEVTQDDIDTFAEVTGDRQWIHVERDGGDKPVCVAESLARVYTA